MSVPTSSAPTSSAPTSSAPTSSLSNSAPAVSASDPATEAVPRRSAWFPWVRLLLVWLAIAVGAGMLMRTPLPLLAEQPGLRNLLVVAASVALAGKALYDTLFYDRCPV